VGKGKGSGKCSNELKRGPCISRKKKKINALLPISRRCMKLLLARNKEKKWGSKGGGGEK
jgi:hypothetical protein